MKNILTALLFFIIGGAIVLIFNSCPRNNVKVEQVIIRDTIPGDSTIVFRYIGETKPDTVWMDGEIITLPPDSQCMSEWLKLQQNYNKWLVYNDTLQNDTSAFISVIDTLHNNKLWGRSYGFQNRRPVAINTTINTTTIKNDNGLYAGAFFFNNNIGIESSLIRNKWIFEAGYSFDKKIIVGVKYRLF